MVSRLKAGKAFVTCNPGEALCRPSVVASEAGLVPTPPASHVACASVGGRVLSFEITELKQMAGGGALPGPLAKLAPMAARAQASGQLPSGLGGLGGPAPFTSPAKGGSKKKKKGGRVTPPKNR
jgi:hypothetical protein